MRQSTLSSLHSSSSPASLDTTALTDKADPNGQLMEASTSKTKSLKRKIEDMEDDEPEVPESENEEPDTPMETPLATPTQSPCKKARVDVVYGDEQPTPCSTPSQSPKVNNVRQKLANPPDKKGKQPAHTPDRKTKLSPNKLNREGKAPADSPEGSETEDEKPVLNADSDSDESIAEAVDEPVTFNKNVQPLDPSVAADWNFLSKKKNRILRLLDAHDGNGFAMRRAPGNLRYGTGPLKQFLVRGGQLVIIVLVGRVSYTSFSDHKSTLTLNVVPMLYEDLQTANGLLAHYSIPQEGKLDKRFTWFRLHLMYVPHNLEPKNYASIRTLTRLAKQGLGYKQFPEVYDATGGVRPKDEMKKYAASQLNKGDLVAVELAVKKWSGQGETAEHSSYDLKGVLLLRKATGADEAGVDNATAGLIKNAFSSFYASLNATS
ncbi:hypothetical protein FS837_000981 [Tulasnella sp. UAMH 9824]|nr:hypothetical protein FS837_000981 [Tulasnella sp. UAMH 9824]